MEMAKALPEGVTLDSVGRDGDKKCSGKDCCIKDMMKVVEAIKEKMEKATKEKTVKEEKVILRTDAETELLPQVTLN